MYVNKFLKLKFGIRNNITKILNFCVQNKNTNNK